MGRIIKVYPTLGDITTDPADVSFLLSLANDMRSANGDKSLVDLPVSKPSDTSSCIIANAFNYGCEVNPSSNGSGSNGNIYFQTEADRDTYLKIVGIPEAEANEWCEKYDFNTLTAPLTPELNQIACDFDAGKRFIEYVDDSFDDKDYWLSEVRDNNFLKDEDLVPAEDQ